MDPLLWKQGILVIGGRCPLGQLRGQRGKIGSEKRLVSGILQKSLYSLLSGLAFPGKIRVKKERLAWRDLNRRERYFLTASFSARGRALLGR